MTLWHIPRLTASLFAERKAAEEAIRENEEDCG